MEIENVEGQDIINIHVWSGKIDLSSLRQLH